MSGRTLAGVGPTGRSNGRLRPHEVAEAAVLADVSVGLCLLGWLLPFGTVLTVLSIVPMAVLGARHRTRAVIAGGVAGAVTALFLGGTGLSGNLLTCAVVGAVVGAAIRRSWSRPRTVAVAVVGLWPVVAGGAVGALALFAGVRRLALEQVLVQWRGASRILHHLGFTGIAGAGDRAVPWLVVHWPLPLAVGLLVAIVLSVWLTHRLTLPVVRYVARVVPPGSAAPYADHSAVAPVPVELREVSFRYPGTARDAVSGLSERIEPGELLTVVGPNGSGKSTLVRLLAGATPTAGEVARPGAAGLGRPGGTALVFQHPARQILGVRVRDDVVWGLPAETPVDVTTLLERVGLSDMADRETSTLSGGELQRLALAGALARRPALLLSDESTAMIDPEGRRRVIDLLAAAADGGAAVVHVTHRPEEAARATRTLELGRASDTPSPPGRRRPTVVGTVRLRGVGHVYGRGSPWEHRALTGVDLDIDPGDGVLVVGRNGSGKSTLAWVLAGLLVPAEGEASLDGRPLDRCVGRVGLAFQHARLQLLGPKVRDDVRAAAGVDGPQADAALALVGLDPAQFGG
ncbi:MAG: ATP-binding cassette domain-containing protein, partial [Acidimicrobiales bacterium]